MKTYFYALLDGAHKSKYLKGVSFRELAGCDVILSATDWFERQDGGK